MMATVTTIETKQSPGIIFHVGTIHEVDISAHCGGIPRLEGVSNRGLLMPDFFYLFIYFFLPAEEAESATGWSRLAWSDLRAN